MSSLGNLLVYGLKQLHETSKKRTRKPAPSNHIFNQVWGYYTQPKLTEEEREEMYSFLYTPLLPPPPKPLTVNQRLKRLENMWLEEEN